MNDSRHGVQYINFAHTFFEYNAIVLELPISSKYTVWESACDQPSSEKNDEHVVHSICVLAF